MILMVNCKKCGREFPFRFEDSDMEFFSENFIRNTAVCDRCEFGHVSDREFKRAINLRLPYADA
jgi:hypothetical protein